MKRHSTAGFFRPAAAISASGGLVARATLAALTCGAGGALAQTSNTAPVPDTAQSLQEVVVTGTRIITTGYSQPTPVTVATTEDLMKSTPTDLADALNDLPQFANSSSPSRSSHNFVSSTSNDNGDVLNLRGVGGQRTLILFDGVRMPPTTYDGSVNVDVIPEMLVQRTDIVTAGASAVYGSDAVAGVVNFVLDRNFTGVKIQAQYGESQLGDNENYKGGIAAGFKFLDDRAHLLLSAEAYDNHGMLRSDRPASNANYAYVGSAAGSTAAPGTAANPYVSARGVSIAASSPTGLMLSGPLAGEQFAPGGTGVVPFNSGTPTGTPGYFTNGDGLVIPPGVTANAPLSTEKAFARFGLDVTPDLNAHVMGTYSRSEEDYIIEANGFIVPTGATLFSGNPYLPADLQSAMNTGGMDSALVDKYPFGQSPDTQEITSFYMFDAGLEGKFGSHWTWNTDFTHSNSKFNVDQNNTINWRNALAAIDVVKNPAGNPVCAASLSTTAAIAAQYANCQPLDLLNESSTPAGLAYSLGTSAYQAITQEDSLQASLQGQIYNLPAGPVGVAVGGEWRNERMDLTSNSDPSLLATSAQQNAYFAGLRGVPAGLNQFYWLTNTGTAHGSVHVEEGFLELNVPILADLPFAQSLDFSTAGRYTDYSTSGSVETWKLGMTWAPIKDITFRGTLSQDIRAPTVYDLFAGPQFGIGQLYDPVTNTTANLQTIQSGNARLDPEKGRTTTFGMVLSPQFLTGFNASLDWYRLDITGAIGTEAAQTIVNNCYNSGGASPDCAYVSRPTPTSFPTTVTLSPQNSQVLSTEGWDLDASYRMAAGPGHLTARLYANYLEKYVNPVVGVTANGQSVNLAGYTVTQTFAYPRIRSTLNLDYRIANYDVFLSEQFIGPSNQNAPIADNFHVDPGIAGVFYTNLTLDYGTTLYGTESHVFFTVNNLMNRQFPIVPGTIPGLNVPTVISLYDTVGRAFTLGARVKF